MALKAHLAKTCAIALMAATIPFTTANATTGPGCLRVVNVASWDVLNMRSAPSANSAIVDRLKPNGHGIIALRGRCEPLSRPWGSRWCPVQHFAGDRTTQGFVKARFIRDQECP